MTTDLDGIRLLVAGDPAIAAAVSTEATSRGAVVAASSAAGTAGDGDGRTEDAVERALDEVFDRTPDPITGVILAIRAAAMPAVDSGDLEGWERCVVQPLRTVFWVTRRIVHEWLASGAGGRLVLLQCRGTDAHEVRSAEIVEAALVSLARSIAKEYGRRAITCNVVAAAGPSAVPGAVGTALFLVTPAAGFVTGDCLRVTG